MGIRHTFESSPIRNTRMYQLAGEYECKIDAKGRLKLPSALLKQLGADTIEFTVNRGFEKHLMLYPKNVWVKKTDEINNLNIYIKKQREVMRYFYRGATKVLTDNSERILIPKSLVEYAGIEKEVVLFAFNEQIEIWAKDKYEDNLESEPVDFSDLAEQVFGQREEK